MKRPVHRAAGILAVAVLVAIGGSGSAAAAPARSRPPNPRIVQSLDSVVSAISALRTPGFVVGVTGGGAGSYERAVGMANVGTNQPMTLSTHFRIGSISKTFTATVILKLIQAHRLRLSDRLSRWEPQVPNARQITIKMLLNMTSGIWDEGGVGPQGQLSSLGKLPGSVLQPGGERAVQSVLLAPADRQPGDSGQPRCHARGCLSAGGLVLLGHQLRDPGDHRPEGHRGSPSGCSSGGWFSTRCTSRQTSFPTRSLTLPSPAATGYKMDVNDKGKFVGYVPQQEPSPSILFGAGNIVSTLHDLQVWARALATGQLLSPAMQRLRLQLLQTGHPVLAAGRDQRHDRAAGPVWPGHRRRRRDARPQRRGAGLHHRDVVPAR